jgi:hypothetical protein
MTVRRKPWQGDARRFRFASSESFARSKRETKLPSPEGAPQNSQPGSASFPLAACAARSTSEVEVEAVLVEGGERLVAVLDELLPADHAVAPVASR